MAVRKWQLGAMTSACMMTGCMAMGCMVAGCATEAVPRSAADPGLHDAASSGLLIDNEISQKCALPQPRFAFDSARIRPGAAPALDAIAKCFTSGPMTGRALTLVGHADPRGELHYNFALGQVRAGTVAEYLGTRGMATDHITTSSLGELEAVGSDAASWSHDRKVEVLLDD